MMIEDCLPAKRLIHRVVHREPAVWAPPDRPSSRESAAGSASSLSSSARSVTWADFADEAPPPLDDLHDCAVARAEAWAGIVSESALRWRMLESVRRGAGRFCVGEESWFQDGPFAALEASEEAVPGVVDAFAETTIDEDTEWRRLIESWHFRTIALVGRTKFDPWSCWARNRFICTLSATPILQTRGERVAQCRGRLINFFMPPRAAAARLSRRRLPPNDVFD